MEQGMKESYRKGIANHPDPKSCAGSRKVAREALTGEQAGRIFQPVFCETEPRFLAGWICAESAVLGSFREELAGY